MAMSIFVFTAKWGHALPVLASLPCVCRDVQTMRWRWRRARRWVGLCCTAFPLFGTVPVWTAVFLFSNIKEEDCISCLSLCNELPQTQNLRPNTLAISQFPWVRNLGVTWLDSLTGSVEAAFDVSSGSAVSCEVPQGGDMLSLALRLRPSISCCLSAQSSPHLLEATVGGSWPHRPPMIGGLQQGGLLLQSQQASKRIQRHGP